MIKSIRFALIMILVGGCIETYQFRITDTHPGIVVEATLSNKSFNDTRNYPSDGRYFTAKVTRTSDVTNIRSEAVSYAQVVLTSDQGEEWLYTEDIATPGLYQLRDDTFKAVEGVQYKLSVITPDDALIESDWQSMPSNAPAIGPISFQEANRQRIVLDQIRDVRGVKPVISLPPNETGATTYYRWRFHPTWLYDAPLASSTSQAIKFCWASSKLYIRDYALQADDDGGYNKELFFMDIEDNERILYEFSVLIEQQSLTEDYYYFWKEMQDLNKSDGVFATPPFNIKSNFTASAGKAFGYFGVVREESTRWYFNKEDLSYYYQDWLPEACANPCGPGCPPPECTNCLRYEGAENVTNVRPSWWGR